MLALRKRLFDLCAVLFLLAALVLAQPAQVHAQEWRDLSADVDGDGLTNAVEQSGWSNAAGTHVTNEFDADSDDDGLTDGLEKLYDTNPLNDRSPGIYVEYREDFQTKQYYPWQRYGSRIIALPSWGKDAVVVRRGATFSVGGPADGTFQITKSDGSLTTLTPVRDPCTGRWNIYVPESGTVGIYTLSMADGGWSDTLDLYVIFQLPTGVSDAFLNAFVYDDDPDNLKDETSIGYYENNPREYTHDDYAWIPEGEWVNHGYGWQFSTEHYERYVVRDYVMPTINGETNTWEAANALGQRVDEVTCFGHPRPLSVTWCVLNPHQCEPYNNKNECTNIANLLATFNRAAGIASRPVWTDWEHSTFDHSTEVWTQRPSGGSWGWYVMHGYDGSEGSCSEPPDPPYYPPSYVGGYTPLTSTSGWYSGGQGVYAAGQDWTWAGTSGGGWPGADDFRQGSWDINKTDRVGKIVKYGWWETRFMAYWNWPAEPQVTGSPPNDWPSLPPPPVAQFIGNPTSGNRPLLVRFTDQSTGHVRSRLWDFGDGGTSTSRNPSHIYATAGDFTVTLTVTGAGGSDSEIKTNYIHVEDGLGGPAIPPATEVVQAGQSVADVDSGLDSVVQFGQVVADYGLDLDGDGRFDQLVFKVQVDARQAGDYWLRGRLGSTLAETVGHVYLAEGPHTVDLPFDGMDFYMNQVDGPYFLEALWLTDVENPAPADFENGLAYAEPGYQTFPYRYTDFGALGATLSGDYRHYTVDTDGEGLVDALVVETTLNVEKAGEYTVQGVLYDGQDHMLAQAAWTGSGPAVALQFDGLRDTAGLYVLQYLHVRDAAGRVTDGISEPHVLGEVPELSAKPILLGVGTPVPVEPSPVVPLFVINPGYSDAGVDTDGDGQFDQLVIEVTVEVEPGEGGWAYRIEGWLVDQNNSLVTWAISDPQVLAEGVQTLSLAFDGRAIHEHGVDGPFTLVALKALPWGTYTVLDKVEVAYTTSAYTYDQFEEPEIAPAARIFEDNMEHGSSQWTWAYPWDLNSNAWYSYSHAWEAQTWSSTGSLTTMFLDVSDYVAPALRVRTCYAMQSPGDAGHLEVSANGRDWTTVATYSDSTTHWSTELLDLAGFGETANLRLRFTTDPQSGLLWYVDDVYLHGWPAVKSTSFIYSPEFPTPGADITFVASYSSIDTTLPVTYTWDFGDGSPVVITNDPIVVHQFPSANDYSVQLGVENPYDDAVFSEVVPVREAVTGVSFTFDPSAPLEDDLVTFTADITPDTAAPPVVYTWNFGDGSDQVVTTEPIVEHTFDTVGTYTVELTATNSYGTAFYRDVVEVDGRPVSGASFIFDPSAPLEDDLVTFTADYTPDGATLPVTFIWDFGDGSDQVVTTAPVVEHTFDTVGTYTVELTATNGYGAAVYSDAVEVDGRPVTGVSFAFDPTAPLEDELVTFTADITPDNATQPVTYIWNFGDGSALVVTTSAIVEHVFDDDTPGTYTVWLTATNGYGSPVDYSDEVTVTPVNDAPDVVDDSAAVAEGGTVSTLVSGDDSVLDNDSDPEGDNMTVNTAPVSGPSHGSLLLNADGTFSYTHDGGESTSDSFTYRVCDDGTPSECAVATVNITIIPVNDMPDVVDDSAALAEGGTVSTLVSGDDSVLDNDSDVDGDNLTVDTSPLSGPSHGSLLLNVDGTFSYTHDGSETTNDGFTYRACDDGVPSLCDVATVDITVTPVNDAPDVVDDSAAVDEGGTVSTLVSGDDSVLDNDSDIEGHNMTVDTTPVSGPSHGSLLLNADGTFSYTHDGSETTSDSFTYRVCDDGTPSQCAVATVDVTVIPVNDAPDAVDDTDVLTARNRPVRVDVLRNDSDAEGDTLLLVSFDGTAVNGGSVTLDDHNTPDDLSDDRLIYTPPTDFVGIDSFTYTISDGNGGTDTATVTVTVRRAFFIYLPRVARRGAL